MQNHSPSAESPVAVSAAYGTAEDETLLGDSRKPYSKDGVLRALRLNDSSTNKPAGLIVQWNCHPESRRRRVREQHNYSLCADPSLRSG